MQFQIFMARFCCSQLPRVAVLCGAVILSACATTQDAVPTLNDPIEGRWYLPKGDNQIQIAPCGTTRAHGFCGTFLPSDATSEDLMNANPFEWGRPLQGAQIVRNLVPGEKPGEYNGTYYLPDLGETLFLHIQQKTDTELNVLVYFGTNTEEVVDTAINSLFSPLNAVDVGWLAIRAAVGKDVLGSEQVWVRDDVE